MPLVLVTYKRGRSLEELASNLAKALPEIVAKAVTIPLARVDSPDVEVRVYEDGPHDVNTSDIAITVVMNHLPERAERLIGSRADIVQEVRKFLTDYDRNVSGYVLIQLPAAAYQQI
jgi:hypothetical protein